MNSLALTIQRIEHAPLICVVHSGVSRQNALRVSCPYSWFKSVIPKGFICVCSLSALIHEMSHFSDVAATQDVAYGEKACLRLAKNQPHQACQFLLLYVGPIVRSLMSGI